MCAADPGRARFLTDLINFMKSLLTAISCLLLPVFAFAQAPATGTVSAADGEPIVGANVVVKGTYTGTFTNADGKYKLSRLPEGEHTLVISFIGYVANEQQVVIKGTTAVTRDVQLEVSPLLADEVVISATRAGDQTPIAFTNMNQEQIEDNNVGIDMPYLLEQTPSLVVSSDGGTGIGYTGLRIRGSDPTRVNVTINGIPLNDAESQGVFWVNMPDFASSTNNIQIQRGVGTSTNGAGAFGGSIDLQTNALEEEAYFEVNNTVGSFNTLRNSIRLGSGMLRDHFTIDARLSQIQSDGYIDRATSDLMSYYVSGAYTGKRGSLRMNVFSGLEETYQAWDGVPKDLLETDRTFNGTGTDGGQRIPAYGNEIDHYQQTHYQLLGTAQLSEKWIANGALHYTKGMGYFEQYKVGQDLVDYGLDSVFLSSDTVTSTDLIRRRWLDNDFYGFTYSLRYNQNGRLEVDLGGGANRYEGGHFGEVIWAQYASNGDIRHNYYDNDATKTDVNAYVKANYLVFSGLHAFVDLQVRNVDYEFLGFDNDGSNVTQDDQLTFFNPKAGLVYDLNSHSAVYASYAVGNKEPSRSDYTESTPNSRPEHESLSDLEAGYRINGRKMAFSANLYYMNYTNQLVSTGEINDVGEATRTNVDESFRRGIELQWGIQLHKRINWSANATFSQNQVVNFTEFVDDWDSPTGEQIVNEYENVDLPLSPSIIAASRFDFTLLEKTNDKGVFQDLNLSLISKYVGKQYIDNTKTNSRSLDPYLVNDVRVVYRLRNLLFKEVNLNFTARNVLNELYSSSAWVYRFRYEGRFQEFNGYFPQAERNFLVGLTVKF